MTAAYNQEQREQLRTLLEYCREMGGVDFFRRAGDVGAQAQDLQSQSSDLQSQSSQHVTGPPVLSATTQQESATQVLDMPRKPIVLKPPPVIDFATAPIAPENRAAALLAIQQEIGDCTRCPLAFEGRHHIVFGDGDPNAELMFVGEGPGADEDAQGVPFVGRAGQLLNNMITAMGLGRERVYIANIVKCRPPQNRVPELEEALTCSQFLFRQIEVIRPKLLVALGATAATYLNGAKMSLSGLRGRLHDCMGTKLLVTYHPAYLLRDPRQKAEAWKDLQLAMQYLQLPAPKRPAG